jgi:hypothetical protein
VRKAPGTVGKGEITHKYLQAKQSTEILITVIKSVIKTAEKKRQNFLLLYITAKDKVVYSKLK